MSDHDPAAEPDANPETSLPAAGPQATRLLLVRHGETTWNAEGRVQGHLDPELSEEGWEQARRAAAALAGEGISAVYSSDLRRARQTAESAAAALGLPVRLDPALRELNLGEWQGLTAPEIEAHYPEAHRRWREDSVTHRPPGGETLAALQERALAAVTAVLARHAGETVLVVTHGGPIRALLCGLLDLPLRAGRRFRVDNAGITRLVAGERGVVLAGFNDTGHLGKAVGSRG